jgi:alkaline phosphatase D
MLSCLAGAATAAPPRITHGLAAGDVRADSVVIWSRASQPGVLHVEVTGGGATHRASQPVQAAHDHAGRVRIGGLKPGTPYRYRVWFTNRDGHGRAQEGRFSTAPAPDQAAPLTLAWSGDLGGQNLCRDTREGNAMLDTLSRQPMDLFIGLGDMIYGDWVCEAKGRYGNAQLPRAHAEATDLPGYWAHWRYNREDPHFQRLLAGTAYMPVWDDHEVVNDVDPVNDSRSQPPYTPGRKLLPVGLSAFLDYNPVLPLADTPKRLYRNLRWGRHAELYFLDTRQYRDPNLAEDSPAFPKTMLGREQLAWFKDAIARSSATWKIIITSVPLSLPTGFSPEPARDGWASGGSAAGFEQELLDLLRSLSDSNTRGVLFLTADLHFAQVLRYQPFPGKPDFAVYEAVAGPLSAEPFDTGEPDPTLRAKTLFVHAAKAAPRNYAEARQWMNAGLVRISAAGELTLSILPVDGPALFAQTLPSSAAPALARKPAKRPPSAPRPATPEPMPGPQQAAAPAQVSLNP